MPCKENKCALCQIYPNSEAGLACDCNCHLDENKRARDLYKDHPAIEEVYTEPVIEWPELSKLFDNYFNKRYVRHGVFENKDQIIQFVLEVLEKKIKNNW